MSDSARFRDDLVISAATGDDYESISRLLFGTFLEDPDEEVAAVERHIFEPARTLMAKRGDELVGSAAALTRRLAVPGGTVPAGHVTGVGVAATARRQGVLTRMMHQQLADIRAAGEPLAILWASEGRIYQRFGYGLSARRMSVSVDAREVRITVPQAAGGRLRVSTPAEVRDAITKLYDQEYANRPGWSDRSDAWWDYRLADLKSRRDGMSMLHALRHEGPGGPDGYALWRTKENWENGPAGEVRITELVASTPDAYVDMWRFLIGLDLTRTTNWWLCALDEPLQYLVNEPRRLGMTTGDALWLRVVDVPAALAARRYAAPAEFVFELTDALFPENAGRWRLSASPEGATCVATGDPADLAFDIRELGSVYLGDASLAGLAAGGLVRELTPGTLATASTAFRWYRAPSAPEIF